MQAPPTPQPGLQVPTPYAGASPYPGARPPGSGHTSPIPSSIASGGHLSSGPPPGARPPYPVTPAAQQPYAPPGGSRPYPGPSQSPYPQGAPGPPPGGRLSLPPASSVYPTPQTIPGGFGPQASRRKRIVVCCDGTWLDSDSSLMHGQVQIPSNVTRLGRAVKPESSDGISQIVFYQPGVGTDGGTIMRAAGGATAEGLAANIREAYAFICLNYKEGDEIFLVGFSRGAFTARSVGGLIGAVGLLTKLGLNDLSVIFKDVEHRNDPDYISPYPDLPFHKKPSALDPKYARELARRGLSRLNISIKAIAVWDTVGALGIPRVPWLERFGLQKRAVKQYTFYDTALGSNVENAFHALALDEHRSSFVPTLWELPRRRAGGVGSTSNGGQPDGASSINTVLRQVWFPGVHANIGGGYPDPGLANITFAWMIAQLETLLDFNGEYLAEQVRAATKYYDTEAPSPQRNRPWSFGFIYRSMTGLYSLAGRTVRTPGEYTRMDPVTGRPTGKLLRDTCEYVHASVRSRLVMEGPGPEDKGVYEAQALDAYTLRRTDQGVGGSGPPALWESKAKASRKKGGGPKRVLMEAPLFATEMRLLSESPEVQDALFGIGEQGPRPSKHSGGRPPGEGGSGRRRHRRNPSDAQAARPPDRQRPISQPPINGEPDSMPDPAGGGGDSSGRRRRHRRSSS